MAKPTNEETATIYQIEIQPQKIFNKSTGEWEVPKVYSSPEWVKYHEKVRVMEGTAQTDDPLIALEFIESGANVTPDPRPLLQEKAAIELEADALSNPARLAELAKYVNQTNEWRAKHGVKPLSVKAPDVPRAISALIMPVQQMG